MGASSRGMGASDPGLRRPFLTPALRDAYDTLVEGLYARSPSVELRDIGVADIDEAYNAAVLDNPLLFDVSMLRYRILGRSTTISPCYGMSQAATERYRSKVLDRLDSFRSDVRGMSEYDRELAVHDMLVNSVSYSMEAPNGRTLIGPLFNGSGVCSGISLAASFLLNGVGVQAGVATGLSNRGGPHAWNMVRLDGEWYHMDITWDLSEYGGHVKHDYMNVSDSFMRRTRTWQSLPTAPSMDRNYHTMSGVVIYRLEDLSAVFRRFVSERRRKIEVRISDPLIGSYEPARGTASFERELSRVGGRYTSTFNPLTGCHVFDVVYR